MSMAKETRFKWEAPNVIERLKNNIATSIDDDVCSRDLIAHVVQGVEETIRLDESRLNS